MQNLTLPTRAFNVVNKAIELFHYHGFHLVGIDRLASESEITKMTFYRYFHSKERFIEICLIVQKERLQEKVVSMVPLPRLFRTYVSKFAFSALVFLFII
ncbi:hypothetical protein AC057_11800 [Acinetobacter genomosp. 33YU]|nr:hypothetical protein AC057_11800 [Acinetobacter genomosp. 33YU]